MSLEVDIHEPDDELTRLIHGLTGSDSHQFEAVLATQFIATQGHVHVITGSLRDSGKMDSEDNRVKWVGDIKYGGVAPGAVYDPVVYADEEYSRGGDHDFLAPAKERDGMYKEAMLDFLKGKQHGHLG
jgi:hypothetical protein